MTVWASWFEGVEAEQHQSGHPNAEGHKLVATENFGGTFNTDLLSSTIKKQGKYIGTVFQSLIKSAMLLNV